MMIWLNGALLDSGAARIDPADRGFLLGDGLFETLAMRGGKILRIDAHLARLRQGCEVLGLPYPAIDLANALAATAAANQLTDAALRLTCTRGPAPRGLAPPSDPRPTLMITAAPSPPPAPPAACIIATITRRNEHSPLARIKSLNYLDNILARQEAASRGADEALLLNTAGRVAEGSAANLFIVRDGAVLTPPITEGALPGTMRAAVLEATSGREQTLRPEDLFGADEIFLANSLGLRAIISIDGRAMARNAERPRLKELARTLAG